jgi:hypothetical protein
MPYLHLDLPGTYPIAVKRELATPVCKLYAEVMETQLWRPNVGIADLGEHNLYHLGPDGLEPITMVMVEFRRGRSAEKRLVLGRAIVDICVELLGVPRPTVMVEFTAHPGEEILRASRAAKSATGRDINGSWDQPAGPDRASSQPRP